MPPEIEHYRRITKEEAEAEFRETIPHIEDYFIELGRTPDHPFDESGNGNLRQERAPWGAYGIPEDQEPEKDKSPEGLVISVSEFLKMSFKPRELLVGEWLKSQSLNMIFAQRGLGKTYLGLSLAKSLTTGEEFLGMEIGQKCRVLWVDGELPGVDTQERIVGIFGNPPPDLLDILSSEVYYSKFQMGLFLNQPPGQKLFLSVLDSLEKENRKPEVILLDNLSSLTMGVDENSNSEQDAFLRFVIALRHLGYTVVFFHHAGKDGEQRGATRREDLLDISIKLSPLSERQGTEAKFKFTFSKNRFRPGEVTALDCELVENENGRLTWLYGPASDVEIAKWIVTLKAVRDIKPQTQTEIVQYLNYKKSSISRHISKLKTMGFVDDLVITELGKKYLEKVYEIA